MSRCVVLAISGSIAAYKAIEVARLLIKQGIEVIPVMTESATRFVGPTTLAGICGTDCHTDMWTARGGELHVDLATRADVVALVPTTADLLAALAHGRADNLVRAIVLCARSPIVAAPAMHPRMWHHPATQRNVAQLQSDGRVTLVGPEAGQVASGDVGMGRMAEPEAITAAILAAGRGDLAGRHVVVSAGPTVEDIDPARFLSNRSSGKMGFAVAERAAARGARVTLVAGPVPLHTPRGVDRVDVRTALEMQAALDDAVGDGMAGADALVMAAAVADYRPVDSRTEKLKREQDRITLTLEKNPDLIAALGQRRAELKRRRPWLVGFALETAPDDGGLVALARGKLARKGVDLVVANRPDAFDGDESRVLLVTPDEVDTLPPQRKLGVADRILDRVARALEASA